MKITKFTDKHLQKGEVKWVLASCNLLEYLENISKEIFEFDVQRRIVSNTYLDRIAVSIINGEPLPAITLTSSAEYSEDDAIDIDKCEILDGLQRTFRLWAYIYLRNASDGYTRPFDELYNHLKSSEEGKKIIDSKVLNRSKIRELYNNNYENLRQIIEAFSKFDIVLNIWFGLSDEQIINKMLTLNAGQRAVFSTHQYELLFLHYIRNLNLNGIRLVREKDNDYSKIKKGERIIGEFLLSSVMIALQSYIQQAPLRISKVNKLRIDDSIVPETASKFFTKNNLENFISILYLLDRKFKSFTIISKWIVKDTTLSGLFAALGSASDSDVDIVDNSIIKKCISDLSDKTIDINGFNRSYQNLSSATTNVGNALRKAIFNYFKNLFKGTAVSWSEAFNMHSYEEE